MPPPGATTHAPLRATMHAPPQIITTQGPYGATTHGPLHNHAPPQQVFTPPEQPRMPPYPVNRMTNWCKNITLPQTSVCGQFTYPD